MKKLLVFILALFCSKIALADAGLPLLVFTRPFSICALIPVILIESFYYSKKYKKLSHVMLPVTGANFVSTFAGWFVMLPVAFLAAISPVVIVFTPFIFDIFCLFRQFKHKPINKKFVLLSIILSLIVIFSFCFFPDYFKFINIFSELGEEYFWWWEGKKNSALILLPSLIVDCLISWWMEYKILKDKFHQIDDKNLKKSVLIANIYSYIFLFIIVFIYYL